VIFSIAQEKLAYHQEFSKYMHGERVPIINVEVSLTNICNAQCEHCFYQSGKVKKAKYINAADLLAFIMDGERAGLKAVTWTGGGEPTLHPDFFQLIDNISYDLDQGLFTNALNKIRYNSYRLRWIKITKTNNPFPLENIKKLSENCKIVGLCINYGSTKQDDEIKEALEIAYKYNLKYVQIRPQLNTLGKTAEIFGPFITDEKLIIDTEKFEECRYADRGYTECEGFHFSPMVWENGDMDVCGYMRHHKKYNIGNIYKHSFTTLCRKMPQSVAVRKDCMICCKNNEINKLISNTRKLECKDFV
jgi:MoaA/NifB/PqqE/SkfB family radical SAM enzyme